MIIRDISALTLESQKLCYQQMTLIINHKLPFELFETLRMPERQAECFANGTSKVQHSVHEDADAWDVVIKINNEWKWEPIYWFQVLGILTLGEIKGIRWGADWNGKNLWWDEKFRDYVHYERIK